MEDANLIATLIPVGDLAEYAFSHEKNEKRRLGPRREFNEDPTTSSRDPTPACDSLNGQDTQAAERKYCIQLGFDPEPEYPTKATLSAQKSSAQTSRDAISGWDLEGYRASADSIFISHSMSSSENDASC